MMKANPAMRLALVPVLALGLSAAQPEPAQPQTPPPGVQNSPRFQNSFKQAEKAAKTIEEVTRDAYEFDYVRDFYPDLPELAFTETARTLLGEAQTSFAQNQFFVSEKKAEAAEKLYDAAEKVYRAEGFFFRDGRRRPEGPPGRSLRGNGRGYDLDREVDFEAVLEAEEELYLVERERDYYRATDGRVDRLIRLSRELLSPERAQTGQAQTGQTVPGDPYGVSFRALEYAEAAEEIAKAARELIRAERGF